MTKKYAFMNVLMLSALVFALLYQSLHIYEHVLSDHKVDFTENTHHTQPHFSADHAHHEKCFVCDFTFSFITYTDQTTFEWIYPIFDHHVSIVDTLLFTHFYENSYIPRGPPSIS